MCQVSLLTYNVNAMQHYSSREGNCVCDLLYSKPENECKCFYLSSTTECLSACAVIVCGPLLDLKSPCSPLSYEIAWIRLFYLPLAGFITGEQSDIPYISSEVLFFPTFLFSYFHSLFHPSFPESNFQQSRGIL